MTIRVDEAVFAQLRADRDARERQSLLPPGTLHASASMAMGCDRATAFRIAAVPESNPPSRDALWNFAIGDFVHDMMQRGMLGGAYANPEIERSWAFEDWLTGRLDVTFLAADSQRVISELKSTSEFAFEMAVRGVLQYRTCDGDPGCKTGATIAITGCSERRVVCTAHARVYEAEGWARDPVKVKRVRQAPDGPKIEHIVQAGISAWAIGQQHSELQATRPQTDNPLDDLQDCAGSDGTPATYSANPDPVAYLHVVYGRKTAVKGELVLHEWKYRADRFTGAVEQEVRRLRWLVTLVRNGEIPACTYRGEVLNPASLIERHKFPCYWCSHQSICVRLGPQAQPVPHVTEAEAAFFKAAAE